MELYKYNKYKKKYLNLKNKGGIIGEEKSQLLYYIIKIKKKNNMNINNLLNFCDEYLITFNNYLKINNMNITLKNEDLNLIYNCNINYPIIKNNYNNKDIYYNYNNYKIIYNKLINNEFKDIIKCDEQILLKIIYNNNYIYYIFEGN